MLEPVGERVNIRKYEGATATRESNPRVNVRRKTGMIPSGYKDLVAAIQKDIRAMQKEEDPTKPEKPFKRLTEQEKWIAQRESLSPAGQEVRDFAADILKEQEKITQQRVNEKSESAHFTPFDLNEIREKIRKESFPFVAPDDTRWPSKQAYILRNAQQQKPKLVGKSRPMYNGREFPIEYVVDVTDTVVAPDGVTTIELGQSSGVESFSTLPEDGGRDVITSTEISEYEDTKGKPLRKVNIRDGAPVPVLKAGEYIINIK